MWVALAAALSCQWDFRSPATSGELARDVWWRLYSGQTHLSLRFTQFSEVESQKHWQLKAAASATRPPQERTSLRCISHGAGHAQRVRFSRIRRHALRRLKAFQTGAKFSHFPHLIAQKWSRSVHELRKKMHEVARSRRSKCGIQHGRSGSCGTSLTPREGRGLQERDIAIPRTSQMPFADSGGTTRSHMPWRVCRIGESDMEKTTIAGDTREDDIRTCFLLKMRTRHQKSDASNYRSSLSCILCLWIFFVRFH